MSEISIAVVGAGHLGSIHAKLWKQNSDAQLVAIVDPDETRGTAIAQEHGAQWYADVSSMPNVDAVVIAAPTSMHHTIAMQTLERGFHTFIEKPVTATYDEAVELISLAQTTKCVVQVGHVERFNPAIRAIDRDSMTPLFIEGHRLATFKPRAIDVSVIHDLMIHDIDLLLWLTRSHVSDIQATGVAVLTDTPDICNVRLTFESGCVANLTASRISAKPMRKLRVFQRDSYLSLDLAEGKVDWFRLIEQESIDPTHQFPITNVSTKYGDRTIVYDAPTVQPTNAIAEEQRSFLQSIRAGANVAVTLSEGAEAVKVAEMIEERL